MIWGWWWYQSHVWHPEETHRPLMICPAFASIVSDLSLWRVESSTVVSEQSSANHTLVHNVDCRLCPAYYGIAASHASLIR
eukprot:6475733-Amphidinium_carterae.1